MGEKCTHCGRRFSADVWTCTKCGWPRGVCPECGSEVGREDKVCAECGSVRQRACEECESLIDATTSRCPECGYDANEAAKQSGKKRAAIGGVVIVLSYGLMSAISGALPSFLGFVGPVLAVPGFLVGGYVGYQGVTKVRAEDRTAADQDTTKELFRGEDYGSLDSITDAFAGENKGSGEPAHVRRERKRKRKVRKQRREHDLPSACPGCSTDWTDGGFEIYDDGNQVQCRECGYSKLLFG